MNIGQSIKKLRKERLPHLTQGEYASTIGITQTYLSQIESGKKKPSTDLLEKIAKDFDMPLPIIFWYGIEEQDVRESKKEYFLFLKPSIDKLIDSIF
jgi:XRE family transcriptional regulator, regulator of sulfur utilization